MNGRTIFDKVTKAWARSPPEVGQTKIEMLRFVGGSSPGRICGASVDRFLATPAHAFVLSDLTLFAFVFAAFHLLCCFLQKIKVNWRASNTATRKDSSGELLVICVRFEFAVSRGFSPRTLHLSFSFAFH